MKVKKENKLLKITAVNKVKERYLSEIVRDENIIFGNNNLIIAPAGSGKTTLINDLMIESLKNKPGSRFLILVSTRTLLDSYGDKLGVTTEEEAEEVIFTSKDYDVMTYAKYGNKVTFDDSFTERYLDIFCDEIHSLFNYFDISKGMGKVALAFAIDKLMRKYENRRIFYLTATSEKMEAFASRFNSIMRNVTKYSFDEVEDIKRQTTDNASAYRTIEQAVLLLSKYADKIRKGEMKVLIYTKMISEQKYIERLLSEQNEKMDAKIYKPISIWSKNNREHEFSERQHEVYSQLMENGRIDGEENVLIINAGAREGWDLLDDKFTVAIIDTEDSTDFVQSLGRIRQDLIEVFYRDKDAKPMFKIMEVLIGKIISMEDRDLLIQQLGLVNAKGGTLGWGASNKILLSHGYKFTEKRLVQEIDGEKKRVKMWHISKVES